MKFYCFVFVFFGCFFGGFFFWGREIVVVVCGRRNGIEVYWIWEVKFGKVGDVFFLFIVFGEGFGVVGKGCDGEENKIKNEILFG